MRAQVVLCEELSQWPPTYGTTYAKYIIARGKLEHKENIRQAASHSVPAVHTYFGGWRPGLLAHLSRFSTTLWWLGRFDGFSSFGDRGDWVSLVMGTLLARKLPLSI
jgi:hypothetical protein